jgi:hypothetical protein
VFSVTPPASPGQPWKEATVYNFPQLAGGEGLGGFIASQGLRYGGAATGGADGHWNSIFAVD